jgi:hypothetical protein
MSFDVTLMCLKDGLPDNFPSSIVRKALDPFISFRNGDFVDYRFPMVEAVKCLRMKMKKRMG